MNSDSKLKTAFSRIIVGMLIFFGFAAISEAQWQKQTVDTKASLRGLSVVNENVIWASGTGGTFLKTTDGGKIWTVGKVPDADKLDFRDVEAFDADTAYLLSIGEGESSRIYKTTDGGATWKLQFKNTNPKAFFDALAFWDKNNGIAMSDPVDNKFLLLKTTDGENWNTVGIGLLADYKGKVAIAKNGEAAFAASGTCLITQGRNNIFLVSGGADARVFRSYNRGLNWTVSDTPIVKGTQGSGIFSIAMRDSKNGVIVGGNYEKPDEISNNLAFTNNYGSSWILEKGLNGYRSGAAYVNKKTIVAVGSSGSDISIDNGKTWKNLDKENYNSVQAKGVNAVWAVGANGLIAKLIPDNQSIIITQNDWKRIDLEQFSFSIPLEMKQLKIINIDSAVWRYSNNDLELTIDFGLYSGLPKIYKEEVNYREEKVKISGKNAKIVSFISEESDKDCKYNTAIYFPKVEDKYTKLSFFICSDLPQSQETAKAIFRSIKFAQIK